MFNYDPSKFEDRVAARKFAEDLGTRGKPSDTSGGGVISSLMLIFIICAVIAAVLG